MPRVHSTYSCLTCNRVYETEAQAVQCETQPDPDFRAQVGDIVTVRAGHGWYDGDRAWIANPDVLPKAPGRECPNGDGNCFSECCTYSFYYVVTATEMEQPNKLGGYWLDPATQVFLHRPIYHVVTLAMASSYRSGWTSHPGHYAPRRVENPPAAVVEASRALLGEKFSHLL